MHTLFARFTGLQFHIVWSLAGAAAGKARTRVIGVEQCCRVAAAGLKKPPSCRDCGVRQLERTLSAGAEGRLFRCRFGVLNFWLPVAFRGETIGVAYFRGLDGKSLGLTRGRPSGRGRALVVRRSAFRRAAGLLRLILRHVQTLDLAEWRGNELARSRQATVALEKEQLRLRAASGSGAAASLPVGRRARPESHAGQAVRWILDRVAREYHRPMRLCECAAELGLNVAYVSAIFSRAVGRSFKAYLTELRMEKARSLLSDPANVVSAVATSLGYASENRFRQAFKQATGLAPRLWRETMQVKPPIA